MPTVSTDDLLDSHDVAALLGQANNRAISVLAKRHADFPAPIVVKRGLSLWHRPDVERWAAKRAKS